MYGLIELDEAIPNIALVSSQENKSDNGSDQPTKSDGIPGNESTNGSDGSALFSLYVLISILVNTREELYTTIISYRIQIVGPNQIRWKILHQGSDVESLPKFLQEFIGLTEIRIKSDRIRVGPVVGLILLGLQILVQISKSDVPRGDL